MSEAIATLPTDRAAIEAEVRHALATWYGHREAPDGVVAHLTDFMVRSMADARALAAARAEERERAAKIAEDYKLDGPDRLCCMARQNKIAERIRKAPGGDDER